MRAGLLRRRVTIQNLGESADAVGQRTATPTTFATRWAAIEWELGAETMAGPRLTAERLGVLRMRYLAGLNPRTMRVQLADGRLLDILDVVNVDERKVSTELHVKERI